MRDGLLRARQNGKAFTQWRGDTLWTHRGVSGPTVLGISREVAERREHGPVTLDIDICPDVSFEELSGRLAEWAKEHPRRAVTAFIEEYVPNRLADALLEAAQIEAKTTGAYLDRKARNRLVTALKGWTLGAVQYVPLEKGEVVAGGIALEEVDPQTMRSRCMKGLYLCGEALDIAGPVGGYNLQAAFATGYVAGETAAKDALAPPPKARE
jgi:predicted Rossmann fold flavoprotein